jgi:hypothetical protein
MEKNDWDLEDFAILLAFAKGANDEYGNRICPFCRKVKLNDNQHCCEKCKKSLLEKYKKEEKGE